MVGQGMLRACLQDADIESVLVIGRTTVGQSHAKLREILHSHFQSFSALSKDLAGLDACFFCLGVSSLGMNEADYQRITRDTTLAAAQALLEASPDITFEYISGQGTDSSAHGRVMWARVKGATENALLQMPFKAVYMLRPGIIIPLDGIRSKTAVYRLIYAVLTPFTPILEKVASQHVTDSRRLGIAMIRLAKNKPQSGIFEMRQINSLASS